VTFETLCTIVLISVHYRVDIWLDPQPQQYAEPLRGIASGAVWPQTCLVGLIKGRQ
jgi:hypothetical protein